MKHFVITLLLLTFSTTLFADKFVVKSFKRIDNKILLNKDKRTDDNNELCGIVLVRTSLVGLAVSASTPVVGNVAWREGDYWVYMSPGTQMIKFFKKGFETLEYTFPQRIEKGKFYILELEYQRTAAAGAVNTLGFVVINSRPEGADVYVNGEATALQTPFQKLYDEGFYRFTLKKPLYDDYQGDFTIKPGSTTQVQATLSPDFGSVTINSRPENARVNIDGTDYSQKTPFTFDKLTPGKHHIRIALPMYLTFEKDIVIEKGKNIQLPVTLKPNFATVTLTAKDGAQIYIDGVNKGTGTVKVPLIKGRHIVEIKRNNYYTESKEINIVPEQDLAQTFTLKPKTGTLSVMSTPIGAEIYVNGEDKGTAPRFINNLITGTYTVQLKKQGFGTLTKTITIAENKTTTLNETLPTGKEVTLNSNPQGATLFVDGINSGTTPKTLTLSFGNHTLKLINGKKTVTQTIAVAQTGKTSWHFDVGENYAETCCGLNMEMVWVPGGTFKMGSNHGDDDEKPVHPVTVNSFYIGKYEVTQKQWKAIMGYNPSYYKGDNLPVENVSWNDAQEFIKKLNEKTGEHYRLPTEAEWEFAARGGNKSHGYKYSGSNNIDEVAWYSDNSGDYTHPIGTKAPNELGIYDMTGNVWEWCSDWYDTNYYSNSPQNNPQGPEYGSPRVCRGGSWHLNATHCRAANRGHWHPGNSGRSLGFRLVIAP